MLPFADLHRRVSNSRRQPKAANFRKRLIGWRILEPEVRRVQHEGPVRAVRDRCDCFGEGPQVPVKQTFIPATPSVTKSRKQRAEIHRGSRRRWIWPPNKAGYTSAIVIADPDPDPNRLLQQRGVHIHPHMTPPSKVLY